MGDEDIEDVKEVLELSFEGWYLWAGLRGLDNSEKVLVAEVAGKVAGVAELKLIDVGETIGNVYYVATHPAYRDMGVASKLLETSLKFFKEKGASLALCSIEHDNSASREFFEKHGFKETSAKGLASRYKLHFFAILRHAMIVPGEIVYTKVTD